MGVVVTDADTSTALAGLRALGQAGISSHAVGSSRAAAGLWSRWADGRAVCPDPGLRGDAFARCLDALVLADTPRFVLPSREETVDALLDGALQHAPGLRSPYTDPEAVRTVRTKALLPELAAAAGLLAPHTRSRVSGAELTGAISSYPAVVKPEAVGGALRTFALVTSAADRDALVARVGPTGRFVVQDHVAGPQIALALVIADRGEVLAYFQQAVLRTQPAAGGGTSLAVSMAPDHDLVRRAARMLHAAGYAGLAHLDVVCSARGYCVLDVNTRFYTSLPLATACGVNLPAAWHRLLTGAPPAPSRGYPTGRRYRWLAADLRRQRTAYRPLRGRRAGAVWDPSDPVPSCLMAADAFARSAATAVRRAYAGATHSS